MFNQLKQQLQHRFAEMVKGGQKLFYIDINREDIWNVYINGFKDGQERQEHNCNSCKSFLRQYGGLCTIVDNKVQSIWELVPGSYPVEFEKSIQMLARYVKDLPVTGLFLNSYAHLGTDRNFDHKNTAVVWNHFYLACPGAFVRPGKDIDTLLGEARTNKEVLQRGLEEITVDAVETVLDLIGQNSIYRGDEFKRPLNDFLVLLKEYGRVPQELKSNYCWATAGRIGAAGRIKNTAIGTLLVNLSEGMELDTALGKFETMMDARNYKRPTSAVTPKMVEQAKEKLTELGYLGSLDRRFAHPLDFELENMLFVDRSTVLTDVFEGMKQDSQVVPRVLGRVEEIGVKDFVDNVLPSANAVYALLENSHLPNLVTMVTASDASPTLFKWANPFSWAYTGGITDSIKERVKAAGGNVHGELRVSLSWHNYDDLDLHVIEPDDNRIYYGSYRKPAMAPSTGQLDVDMNAGSGTSRTPVENTVWTDPWKMKEGRYKVVVHQFSHREKDGGGFEVQIECRGEVFDLAFPKNPRQGEYQGIVEFDYTRANGVKMVGNVASSLADKEQWNLKTNRFHKVKMLMRSPNAWGQEAIGNQHLFLILENCASNETTRPFFNEFLKDELTPHRKFFEILAGKLKLAPTTNQVAGLGFSLTQRNHLYVQVGGSFTRTLKINF